MTKVRRIIMICSGNICRSPMAEALARRAFSEARIPAQVISMGTLGIFGRSASEHAVEVCSVAGLDLSGHSSQGVSFGILDHADAIVVMEEQHRAFLLQHRPQLKNIWLFSSFDSADETDVSDPMGQDRAAYQACFDRLEDGVEGLVRAVENGLV